MLEMELKFAVADRARLATAISGLAVGPTTEHLEIDQYFNAPDRDFGVTDEAFRLRSVGEENLVTYKGPKQAGSVKTRTEIEVNLAPGADASTAFARMVTCLGYRPSGVVRKKRTQAPVVSAGFDITVCIDDVDGLGSFAEVEIVAPADRRTDAESALWDVAKQLGLRDVEKRSYLRMTLERQTPKPG